MVDGKLAGIKGVRRRDHDALGVQEAQKGLDESDFGHSDGACGDVDVKMDEDEDEDVGITSSERVDLLDAVALSELQSSDR